jgi:hypothetical protein
MKVKTPELIGPTLDWAVGKCLGMKDFDPYEECFFDDEGVPFEPSGNWSQGGSIIEREGISIGQNFNGPEGSFATANGWYAYRFVHGGVINPPRYIGSTPLVAALRCYVASKLGDEVEIPEELA